MIHNTVVPPWPLSLEEVAGAGRAATGWSSPTCGEVAVGNSTVRPVDADGVATVIARVLPAHRGRGFGTLDPRARAGRGPGARSGGDRDPGARGQRRRVALRSGDTGTSRSSATPSTVLTRSGCACGRRPAPAARRPPTKPAIQSSVISTGRATGPPSISPRSASIRCPTGLASAKAANQPGIVSVGTKMLLANDEREDDHRAEALHRLRVGQDQAEQHPDPGQREREAERQRAGREHRQGTGAEPEAERQAEAEQRGDRDDLADDVAADRADQRGDPQRWAGCGSGRRCPSRCPG